MSSVYVSSTSPLAMYSWILNSRLSMYLLRPCILPRSEVTALMAGVLSWRIDRFIPCCYLIRFCCEPCPGGINRVAKLKSDYDKALVALGDALYGCDGINCVTKGKRGNRNNITYYVDDGQGGRKKASRMCGQYNKP